jgi:hypothetical protein
VIPLRPPDQARPLRVPLQVSVRAPRRPPDQARRLRTQVRVPGQARRRPLPGQAPRVPVRYHLVPRVQEIIRVPPLHLPPQVLVLHRDQI